MSQDFITYERFEDTKLLKELTELLDEHHVQYELEDNSLAFDPSMSNSNYGKEYLLKLHPTDFEKVHDLRLNSEKYDFSEIPADYYLLQFTHDELVDVVAKRDEWSSFDYLLAQQLLRDGGKELSAEEIHTLHEERNSELAQPEKSQGTLVTVGFLLAVLGGLFGLFIGWHLVNHKKNLPNGEQVFAYSETDRKSGKTILIIGSIAVLIGIGIRVYTKLN